MGDAFAEELLEVREFGTQAVGGPEGEEAGVVVGEGLAGHLGVELLVLGDVNVDVRIMHTFGGWINQYRPSIYCTIDTIAARKLHPRSRKSSIYL